MTALFVVEPNFFEGHLNGVRIPLFLRMLQLAGDGSEVHATVAEGRRVRISFEASAETMDSAYSAVVLDPVDGPVSYALGVFQKGRTLQQATGVTLERTALMLNDARARQAGNQFYELLSGRFGADLYRMTALLRYVQGLRRDRAQMDRFDTVYVQTAPEAEFLRRKSPGARAQIEIFNNGHVTRALFPASILVRGSEARLYRFVLPVPPGVRREPEYAWFLRRLGRYPDLLAQTRVLAPQGFARHIPQGVAHDVGVPDFQAYLAQFDCALVPTKHYTGLNNRVFQAAASGCHVVASPEALEGLIPGSAAVRRAPRNFAGFREAMLSYAEAAVSPEILLGEAS